MNRIIFKNWNIRRILYLFVGLFFVFTAIKDQTWWIAIFGLYFASMSIFRFGCAAGNCEVNYEYEKENSKS